MFVRGLVHNRAMSRPDERPFRRLKMLEPRRSTLERCVFCPKLCRSACPVSNTEPRETLTPWGKMSMAYFVANESVALARSFADPAWACTGCFGCREQCDHRNDVAGTLFDARAALADQGMAPPSAARVIEGFEQHGVRLAERNVVLRSLSEVDAKAPTALLLGCSASRGDGVDRDAVLATAAIVRDRVSLVNVCCGAPLLYAGDKLGFAKQGERLARALERKERLIVVDAGCAAAIRVHHASNGVSMPVAVEHFAESAVREIGRLECVPGLADGPVRYHDACQLGRGLGVYDQPRALLSRALGRAPEEFERNREGGRCSGAGGLLPITMPEVAARIGRERIDEHRAQGGGTVVSTCGSSLRAFRKQGATALDLVSVVARALRVPSR